MPRRVLLLATAAAAMLPATLVAAQGPGCLSLRGSEQCPSFQDAYINPTNLSTRFSWFSEVTDVATFDEQFALYFSDPSRFTAEKKQKQLACNGSGIANTTLQWERTIMCGKFTQMSYSEACNVQSPTMICQDTCREWSAAQTRLVENPALCAPDDELSATQNRTRSDTLTRDFVACTDWTTLVSTNNATCVEGRANEGNCGYGPGVSTELCTACDPSGNRTIDACCYDQNTSLSQCASYGHPAAAAIVATTSVATGLATSTGASSASSSSSQRPTSSGIAGSSANDNSSSGTANLSNGALAGLIIGCIIGALVLGAFLALVVFRRRRNGHQGGIAPMYAAQDGARSRSTEKPWHSEDGMGHGRSMDASPLSNEKGIGGSGAAALAGTGVGAGAIAGAAVAGSSSRDHSTEDRQERPISGVTTQSSGTDGRGTTVPMVRDQYTGQDIYPGEDVIAIYPYNASLNDEITLEPEQRVTIVRLYDDGWALGRTSDGTEGALPLVCVSSTKGEIPRVGGTGSGTTGTGTGTEDDGMTSGAEFTSDADGAVTADEGFTSDAPSRRL